MGNVRGLYKKRKPEGFLFFVFFESSFYCIDEKEGKSRNKWVVKKKFMVS